jgi:hypothetical protein
LPNENEPPKSGSKDAKKSEYCRKNLKYELQKKLVRLRERAHDLYFVAKMSKRAISRRLKVFRNFVWLCCMNIF